MSDWQLLVARDPEASVLWDRDVVPVLSCEPSYVAVYWNYGCLGFAGNTIASCARAWVRSDAPKFYDHCFQFYRDPVARWEKLW